jgi:hypothetical protein
LPPAPWSGKITVQLQEGLTHAHRHQVRHFRLALDRRR